MFVYLEKIDAKSLVGLLARYSAGCSIDTGKYRPSKVVVEVLRCLERRRR